MYLQPDDGVNSETLLQFIIKMFMFLLYQAL